MSLLKIHGIKEPESAGMHVLSKGIEGNRQVKYTANKHKYSSILAAFSNKTYPFSVMFSKLVSLPLPCPPLQVCSKRGLEAIASHLPKLGLDDRLFLHRVHNASPDESRCNSSSLGIRYLQILLFRCIVCVSTSCSQAM